MQKIKRVKNVQLNEDENRSEFETEKEAIEHIKNLIKENAKNKKSILLHLPPGQKYLAYKAIRELQKEQRMRRG